MVCVCVKVVCERKFVRVTKLRVKESACANVACDRGVPDKTHQGQPSATSATPATPKEGGCRQAQPLPRKTPRSHSGTQARHQSQPSPISAKPDVAKCNDCRAK